LPTRKRQTAVREEHAAAEADSAVSDKAPTGYTAAATSVRAAAAKPAKPAGSANSDAPAEPARVAAPPRRAKAAAPTGATKPARPARPAKPPARREQAKPPEPLKASQPAKPAEPSKPAERPRPAKPAERAKPATAARATGAAKAAERAKPPEPVKLPGAVKPAEPVKPAGAPKPAERAKPAETLPAPGAVQAAKPAGGFAALGLSEVMMNALRAAEYLDPTPVQAGLIPRAMAGVDVMGQAQTGTGKTAAFAIPILEMLKPHRKGANPEAMVLVPTRELAVQVRDECHKLAEGRGTHIVAVYGGKPIRKQIEQLRSGAEMIVGTPGRVLDLMGRGALMLGELRFVVLDEADRMLDIGFRPDIEKILRQCPQSRQTMLLSATIAPPVKRLAERYMRDPEALDFSPKNLAVETIEQFYFTVDPERKFDLLVTLLEREKPAQAIVFCRTKRGTDKVYRRLSRKFQGADTIHGDLAQSARDRVMKEFREGNVRCLVATDVVGRGIDVTGISHIINFDVPQFADDYVHRVGRTGRMGREGVAFTFVSPEEGNELTRIEMRINRLLKRDEIPGFEAISRPQPTEALGLPQAAGGPTGRHLPVEPAEPPAPKPVFGRTTKRYRRAL
jgi:ATP-dependent RNA helicase DeaD